MRLAGVLGACAGFLMMYQRSLRESYLPLPLPHSAHIHTQTQSANDPPPQCASTA